MKFTYFPVAFALDLTISLFGADIEESLAKVQYVRSRGVWRLFWKRADGKWHGYPPHPEAASLAEALQVIDQDANACFFG